MRISDWSSDVCSSDLRSYGLLQPYQSVRPTGRQSFFLRRPSTVEVMVNGQLMRRVRLDPGPYDLSDFPTGYGANDVRLNIVDDTGKAETLRFNMFFDQNQLDIGRASGVERVCLSV